MKQRALKYGFTLLMAAGVSSCSGSIKHPLAGHYYTALSEDGEPGLYFDDSVLGPVCLEYVIATGKTKNYIVACGDSCYMFPVAAATAEQARRFQIGPLTEVACKQKVFQLTSDSIRLESIQL